MSEYLPALIVFGTLVALPISVRMLSVLFDWLEGVMDRRGWPKAPEDWR